MIETWLLPSTVTALGCPWTGIILYPDGSTGLVYVDAVQQVDANEKLAHLVDGGRLIATLNGHYERRILSVATEQKNLRLVS